MRNSLKFLDPFFMKFSESISDTKKKMYARWVPQMLADDHRKKCMGAALTFLERYHRDGDKSRLGSK
jgi:hypothetical protein